MSHFALLDKNNIVTFVVYGRQEDDGKEQQLSEQTGQIYKQTSYNTRGGVHYNPDTNEPSADQTKAFRKNFAGLGYTYDQVRDAFIPPQQYSSWSLNESTCLWEPPMPYPTDGQQYSWNEESHQWVSA